MPWLAQCVAAGRIAVVNGRLAAVCFRPAGRFLSQGRRNAMVLVQPVAKVDQSAAFAAERPPSGRRFPEHGTPAGWAIDNRGHGVSGGHIWCKREPGFVDLSR